MAVALPTNTPPGLAGREWVFTAIATIDWKTGNSLHEAHEAVERWQGGFLGTTTASTTI